MAENKTKPTIIKVSDFIAALKSEKKRQDAKLVLKILKTITGKQAKMWGPTIIGFDQYHYQYDSGHEGDMCMIGFSPRAQALTFYLIVSPEKLNPLLKKLGKHKRSKACLYINKLADIDITVLEEILTESYKIAKKKYR